MISPHLPPFRADGSQDDPIPNVPVRLSPNRLPENVGDLLQLANSNPGLIIQLRPSELSSRYFESSPVLRNRPFFSHPIELAQLLPPDFALQRVHYIPEENAIVADLPNQDRVRNIHPDQVKLELAFESQDLACLAVKRLLPPDKETRESKFIQWTDQDLPHGQVCDITVADRNQSNWNRLKTKTLKECQGQLLDLGELTPDKLEKLHSLSSAVDCCLRQIDPQTSFARQQKLASIPQRFRTLMTALLANVTTNPLQVKIIMQKIDYGILPLMKEVGFDLGDAFRTADEALNFPLLFLHKDEARLVALTEGLKISSRASEDNFLANLTHLRFFHTYDDLDVLQIPRSLDCMLPHIERLINKISIGSRHQSQRLVAEDVCELSRKIRTIQAGTVILADFHAFDNLLDLDQKNNPRSNHTIKDEAYSLFGMTSETFHRKIQGQAELIVERMKRAYECHPIIKEEFGNVIPLQSEYVYGFYGSDELKAVFRFNAELPPDDRISLSEVLTGSGHHNAKAYYRQHRGKGPPGSKTEEIEKRMKTQFSEIGRRHCLWGREVLFSFNALIRGEPRPSKEQLQMWPAPESLNEAAMLLGTWSKLTNVRSDVEGRKLIITLIEYLTRFPPSLINLDAVQDYVDEGNYLARRLTEYCDTHGTWPKLNHIIEIMDDYLNMICKEYLKNPAT